MNSSKSQVPSPDRLRAQRDRKREQRRRWAEGDLRWVVDSTSGRLHGCVR
jgi:hypothetical protein